MKRIILPILILICAASFAVADGTPPLMKIDESACAGLSGVASSICYYLENANSHDHGWERYFGANPAAGGTDFAMSINDSSVVEYQADGGADTYGTALQILGSNDTPSAGTANQRFSIHEFFVSSWEWNNEIYYVQLIFGASAAAGLAAGTYTEFIVSTGTAVESGSPFDVQALQQDAGTSAWVRVWADGQATGTLNFYIGIHEYLN